MPRISLTNLIKKRAYLYLDEGMAHTLDDLLDSGYNVVMNKKQERDILKDNEQALRQIFFV